jgi:hypothetical protein
MNLTVERRAVTLPQLVGWGILGLTQAFTAGVLWAQLGGRIDALDARLETSTLASVARSNSLDSNVAEINSRLAPFETAMFRLSTVETTVRMNNDSLNNRMDRIVESLGNKLDSAIETVDMLRSDVRVLTQRVDTQLRETSRTGNGKQTMLAPRRTSEQPGL